jgi:hypothetical protein
VSSRTPEGDPNRCAVCGHRCRVEPSCLSPDAPCPSCGHLLWFPADTRKPARRAADRPRRQQNPPTVREPQVQAQRLVSRLIRRAEGRLGKPGAAVRAVLSEVREPYPAERLLSLLYLTRSWSDLLAVWRAEQGRPNRELRQTGGMTAFLGS